MDTATPCTAPDLPRAISAIAFIGERIRLTARAYGTVSLPSSALFVETLEEIRDRESFANALATADATVSEYNSSAVRRDGEKLEATARAAYAAVRELVELLRAESMDT